MGLSHQIKCFRIQCWTKVNELESNIPCFSRFLPRIPRFSCIKWHAAGCNPPKPVPSPGPRAAREREGTLKENLMGLPCEAENRKESAICTCGCRVGSANPCQSTWGGHDYRFPLRQEWFPPRLKHQQQRRTSRYKDESVGCEEFCFELVKMVNSNWIWLNTASWLSWLSSFNELARDATFWTYWLVFLVWTLAGNISNCSCGVRMAAFRMDLVPWTNCRGILSGCQWLMIDNSCKTRQLLILLVSSSIFSLFGQWAIKGLGWF